jgi:acyl-CoA synthetase (AMP-forming)/AMP-acid ligase II
MSCVIGSILCFLDLVAYLFTLGPIWTLINSFRTAPKIVNVSSKDDAARRRDYTLKGLVESPCPNDNVSTLTDLFLYATTKFASRPCFGTRDYLGELSEPDLAKGQRFKPKHFGQTMWMTYAEVEVRVKNFGAGLKNLGMEPQPDPSAIKHFDEARGNFTLCIYENTCADWLTACQGSFSQCMVTATIYATMGFEALKDIVNETSGYALLCNRSNLGTVGKMAASMPTLKVIIYSDDMIKKDERMQKPEAVIQEIQTLHQGRIRVLSVDEVIQLGKEKPVRDHLYVCE